MPGVRQGERPNLVHMSVSHFKQEFWTTQTGNTLNILEWKLNLGNYLDISHSSLDFSVLSCVEVIYLVSNHSLLSNLSLPFAKWWTSKFLDILIPHISRLKFFIDCLFHSLTLGHDVLFDGNLNIFDWPCAVYCRTISSETEAHFINSDTWSEYALSGCTLGDLSSLWKSLNLGDWPAYHWQDIIQTHLTCGGVNKPSGRREQFNTLPETNPELYLSKMSILFNGKLINRSPKHLLQTMP